MPVIVDYHRFDNLNKSFWSFRTFFQKGSEKKKTVRIPSRFFAYKFSVLDVSGKSRDDTAFLVCGIGLDEALDEAVGMA